MTGAAVLFDLDGTLVDTNYLHTVAWARALADVGRWAPMNAIHRLVGMGGDQLVTRLFDEDIDGVHDARKQRYRELLGEAKAFPGAAQLLRALHDRGVTVILATSSPSAEVDALLAVIDAGDVVDAATTSEDVSASKPDPAVFARAMEAHGVDPTRALGVGDSVWDVQAARAAGIGLIAVETGGFSQHELSQEGALHVYRDVEELDAQLLTSPIATLL